MDDQKFDDIIKRKVGGFEERGFEPASLAALHHQMASVGAVPWYSSYRTEIIAGSAMAFCTLLILWTQWYWNGQHTQTLEDEMVALKTESKDQLAGLQHELEQLKSVQQDTAYIIDTRVQKAQDQEYTLLLYRIAALEYEIQKLKVDKEAASEGENMSSAFSLDKESNHSTSSSEEKGYSELSKRLVPRNSKEETVRAERDEETPPYKPLNKDISVKTIREIEKHYQPGVGIKIGPMVEVSKGIYPEGVGQFNLGYGVHADFILSPSLSLETGASYFRRYYEIDSQDELSSQLPGVDESLGDLKKAETDYWMIEVPLNLKYRYPVSLKTHWIGGIGYSPIIYFRQVFEYDYAFDDGSGGSPFMIHSEYESNKLTLYPGTLNFSIGLSNQLKNKKILETSLYYQYGLGEMGVEKTKPQFLGLRGVYWFTVR